MAVNNFNPELYMGNENLPSSKATFEYTPEQIKEIQKCTKNITHFAETHFFITTLDDGKQKISLYRPQKRIIKNLGKYNRVCVLASRQTGKTTIMSIYALWLTCFQGDKTVMIVANKESTAISILRRIRMAYEQLPNWLKPGVKQWGKTEVVFANDSRITISSTSSSSSRGETANCLIIDEAAYIQPHIMDEFWNSVIPIISSSSNTKIFLISTANGTSNKFYDIYSSAERGEAKEWHSERMEWHELPKRGKKWKADMIESLGSQEAFDQEFGCMFIETGESAIAGSILDRWRKIRKPPIASLDGGHYLVWEPPKPDHIYSIGVDVAEGVGEAASCAQVLDITDLTNIRQVACYHDRLIDPHFFAEKLNKIANQWGRPYLAIERNNAGGQVIDGLFHTFGYNKFINVTTTGGNKDRFGVYSATSTKYKGVSNMRYWVNTLDVLDVNDIGLVQELETFIRRPNGVWKKKDGRNVYDDRVDAFFWALLCLETEICQEYFDVVQYDERGKPSKIKNLFVEAPELYKLDDVYQHSPGAPMPLLFGSEPDDPNNPSMNELIHGGWNVV